MIVLAFFQLAEGYRMTDLYNAVLAWVAAMTHVWAAVHTSGKLRIMFIVIASLALLYSVSYWWLFFHPNRVQEWSNFLRPYGIVTWVVAWSVEPVVLVLYLRRKAREIEQVARQAVERTL